MCVCMFVFVCVCMFMDLRLILFPHSVSFLFTIRVNDSLLNLSVIIHLIIILRLDYASVSSVHVFHFFFALDGAHRCLHLSIRGRVRCV